MTLAAQIGFLTFDDRTGEIELPGWQSQVFVLPGSAHAGVHLIPPVGQESELTLTRFGAAADAPAIFATQKSLESTDQYITLGRLDYGFTHNLKFHIVKVSPVRISEIPHASGFRTASYSYSPACEVITKWRVLPLPIT